MTEAGRVVGGRAAGRVAGRVVAGRVVAGRGGAGRGAGRAGAGRGGAGRGAGRVVAGRTARRAARAGGLWGLVFGAYVAASALGYATTYPTPAARAKLAASFASNAGLAALLGPAHRLDTVAGFTGWRATGVLTVVGAIWGLFLATRLLRGEEDAGRWELYLSGPTTRRAASLQATVGLGAGLGALWAVTALCSVAAGASPDVGFSLGASLYLATCLVAGAAMMLAVGALLSEVAASRRQANGLGGGLIGLAFVVRMIADSTTGGAWLRWASPFGWIEQLRPLAGPAPAALVPIAALTVGAGVGAVAIAARRDLGSGALPSRDAPRSHTRLLGSPLGLAVRQVRATFVGWGLGVIAFGLVIGLVANAGASAITSSASVQQAIARLGGHGNPIKEFVGFALLEGAALVAFAAAAQIGAWRAEEASGRLDHLLAAPVSRRRWLASRLGAAAGLVVGVGVLGGVATWVGVASQGATLHGAALHGATWVGATLRGATLQVATLRGGGAAGAGFGSMVAAGLNLAPAGLCVLGAGTLVYGLKPRWAPVAAYVVVGWSFLVQLVATVVTSNRLLLDTSLLAHVPPVPAAPFDWSSAGWLVALGLVSALAGGVAFGRRDLAGE